MSRMNLLSVAHLSVEVDGHAILKGFNLSVNKGEVHAIMGPNGSGKSTLAYTLAGKDRYIVTSGSIDFMGQSIVGMSADDRARLGIFLAFQYPVEIPGLNNAYFLRAALNSLRKSRGQEEIDAVDFLAMVRNHLASLRMDERFLHRAVNEGFSGGEKKRNEILQMSLLEPRLCILDETDSGLDIDALKVSADGINALRNDERSMIVVTHYQRLLNYITPDVVHVMVDGRIIESGGKELALKLEQDGYDSFIAKAKHNGLEVISS
jgi:Fe-S cluster assembly ATP-binding protein